MSTNELDVEVPVGFTGEWKPIGALTVDEHRTIALASSQVGSALELGDYQGATDPRLIRLLAEACGSSVEDVRGFIEFHEHGRKP